MMKRILLVLSFAALLLAQKGDRPANLSGAFFQYDNMTAASTVAYVDEVASLGEDTIITIGTVTCADSPYVQGNLAFDSRYLWLDARIPTVLPALLSEAQRRGIRVYLGLANTEQCADQSGDAAESGTLASFLLANYSGYGPIAGWYIPNEAYIQDGAWLQSEVAYFSPVVAAIRARSSLPILESPYLVNYSPYLASEGDPAAAAATALQFLKATGIDVLAYEDGMGGRLAGGAIEWNAYPTMGDYLRAISAAVGPSHLWVIHELFNDTWGIDAGEGSEGITRLNQQIAMVPDALIGKRLTWTQQFWMSASVPGRNPEAQRLLAGYRATHGMGGTLLIPGEILWLSPTTPVQGYLSATLKDGTVGDPFNLADPGWVEVSTQNPALLLDLWGTFTVDWVSLHTSKLTAAGVEIPQEVQIWGSIDGVAWDYLTSPCFSTDPQFDGEWDVGNVEPLGAAVRFLWIYLPNAGKTRIAEVEVIGR